MNQQDKKFDVILADPPWALGMNNTEMVRHHYRTMSTNQIKGMGKAVQALSKPNSWCFLWVTNGTHRIGYGVLEAWGFTPRNTYTWVKIGGTSMGRYVRNRTEHLLIGTRGKVLPAYRNQANFGFFPLQDHSHKPEEVFAVIERLCGAGKTGLELFARRRPSANNQMHWSVWGDQIESDISLAEWGYPLPNEVNQPETKPCEE